MDASNPISAFSFVAGPALLTNPFSVLLNATPPFAKGLEQTLLDRQLALSERRPRAISLGLTSFYTAVGAFALATLMCLPGAARSKALEEFVSNMTTWVSLGAVLVSVGALVLGAVNPAIESVMSHRTLSAEAELRALQRRAL